MPERTDTSGFELKPKGEYVLEVERVIKSQIGKEGGPTYPGYKWFFEIRACDQELDVDKMNMFMFKSQMGDILRAIGAKEGPEGVFEWEFDDAEKKIIKCHLTHVEVNGKLREQLIEIVPFTEKLPPKEPEAVAWDS